MYNNCGEQVKRAIEAIANLFLKNRKDLVTPMDSFFSVMHNILRIFIIVILPLGLFAGLIGAYLRKKFEGSAHESVIVTGGMLLIATVGLFGIFIYFNYFR